jgi:hypothetical protein
VPRTTATTTSLPAARPNHSARRTSNEPSS